MYSIEGCGTLILQWSLLEEQKERKFGEKTEKESEGVVLEPY